MVFKCVVRNKCQKTLICAAYRKFSDLFHKEKMSINQQLDRWKIFHAQVEIASKDVLILGIGDMNIDTCKWEEASYYQKKIDQEYQLLVDECGLELLNFGITWRRNQFDAFVESALDHAFTNKPSSVHGYFKTEIDYSDHHFLCVDLKMSGKRMKNSIITSRDLRKMKSNPKYFLNELSKIEWGSFVNMVDVDDMEKFWTTEINKCLNFVAPWKTRKLKQKQYCLPNEV